MQGLSLTMLCAAIFCPVTLRAQATVEGKVTLPQARYAPVPNERYEIVRKAGVLATDPPRAVVYLEGNFPRPAHLPTEQVVQKNLAFSPALLPIAVGTKVEFPNLDDTYHNVFSYSPTKRFDLGRCPSGQNPPASIVFDRAGLVVLRCDIHEHMRAIVLVLDTPHFALSDPAGNFRLTNLPVGHFVLKTWLDSKTTQERPVDLRAGETLRVNLP